MAAPVTTLEAVAACFHRAVTVLQAEPAAKESLSAFFARAAQRAAGPLDACFAGIRRDPQGAVMVSAKSAGPATNTGSPTGASGPWAVVTMTQGAPSHSQYDDGRSELAIPYRFTAAGLRGAATTTILRVMGGRP